jgi:hypothetical protein
VKRVKACATLAALALSLGAAAHAREHPYCDTATHYTNTSDHCVHRPEHALRAPEGWTAQCRDGAYSFSEHRRGTCSHHGGVDHWR